LNTPRQFLLYFHIYTLWSCSPPLKPILNHSRVTLFLSWPCFVLSLNFHKWGKHLALLFLTLLFSHATVVVNGSVNVSQYACSTVAGPSEIKQEPIYSTRNSHCAKGCAKRWTIMEHEFSSEVQLNSSRRLCPRTPETFIYFVNKCRWRWA
jgi:hypothetical protein